MLTDPYINCNMYDQIYRKLHGDRNWDRTLLPINRLNKNWNGMRKQHMNKIKNIKQLNITKHNMNTYVKKSKFTKGFQVCDFPSLTNGNNNKTVKKECLKIIK